MQRILQISKYYYPYFAGIEYVAHSIASTLSAHREEYEQKVICFNDSRKNVKDNVNGVEVIRVGIEGIIKSQPISITYHRRLRKVIKEFAPDIIHLHLPNPYVCWCLLPLIPKSTKLIVHWHSDIIEQKRLYKYVQSIERKILRRADKIVITSPNYGEHSQPLQLFKEKFVVVPNLIDIEQFKLTSKIESRVSEIISSANNKPILLAVGRHVPYKGMEFLIRAAQYIKEPCEIVIAGSGVLTDSLKTLASDCNNIKFIGRVALEELIANYYAADIFAFPSITKNEAFGVALAEAMYCKCAPVVFSIEGSGVNWVSINGESGVEVANRDIIAYAKAIDKLLQDKEKRELIAENAHKRVCEKFSTRHLFSYLTELYKI